MARDIRLLTLDRIQLSDDLQLRDGLNDEVVRDYADRLAAKTLFPPLIVVHDGSVLRLVDGYHRYYAARRAGLIELHCDVRPGTKEDAEWLACSVNARHGLRRTNSEKKRAILKALAHPNSSSLTVREVAAHVGCHFTTVAQYRAKSSPAELVENLQDSNSGTETALIDKSPSAGCRDESESSHVSNEAPASFALSEFADSRTVQSHATPQGTATEFSDETAHVDALAEIAPAEKVSSKPKKPVKALVRDCEEALGQLYKAVDHLDTATNNAPKYHTCRSRLRGIGDLIRAWGKESAEKAVA